MTKDNNKAELFDFGTLTKIRTRLDVTAKTLKEMINGGRPDLTSGEDAGKKWLRAQLEETSEAGLLTEPPNKYYTIKELVSIMGYNPAPYPLFEAAEKIEEGLAESNISTRILGTKRHLPANEIRKLQKKSDLMIAVPADLKAIAELIEVMKQKFENKISKPLIIENTNNILDPILADLQLLEYDNSKVDESERRKFVDSQKLAESYGIYITKDNKQTIEVSKQLIKAKEASQIENKPFIPDNAIMFVATGTRKKFKEIKHIQERFGVKTSILPIDMLLEYISPKETSNSYEGNVAEKIEAAFKSWERMKPEEKVVKLKELGIRLYDMGFKETNVPLKEEEIFFLAEDSGFHFTKNNSRTGNNISTEPEFSQIAHKVSPNSPFPGVETGPDITANYGVANFFANAEQVIKRYEDSEVGKLTKSEKIKNRGVIKKSIIAVSQLKPNSNTSDAYMNDNNSKRIVMYASEVKGHFVDKPKPSNGSLEIDNFLIPDGQKKTEAELGDNWVTEQSPRALAFKGLIYDQSLAKEIDFLQPALKEKYFKINIAHDTDNDSNIETLQKSLRTPDFKVESSKIDINKLSDVQTKLLEGKDAVVLAFDPNRAKEDFWRNLWTFSSLMVGEQTRDKHKLEKPLYLINPKDEAGKGALDYLEDLSQDLHLLGTIPQTLNKLYRSVGSVDEAVAELRKDRENYLHYTPPSYSKGEKIEPEGETSDKDFNVAIFISASNENEMIKSIGEELSEKLSLDGFGVFSGGGLYSGMGAITKKIYELKKYKDDLHHTALNVPHIMEIEDGKEDIREYVDHFQLCRDIYERIEGLLAADAVIVAPGGMGTIQELAGFAFLKDIALKEPENPYTQGFENKELVIINNEIEVGGQKRGFYDELIKIIPPEDLTRLGIHVVETPEEAVSKMRELRNAKRQRNNLSVETHQIH